MKRILLAGAAASALVASSAHAATTTFDFSVVFDINSQASFNAVFGCTVASPCHGDAFVAGNSLYEETNTAPTAKTIAHVGSVATAPALNTAFIQNANPTNQLVFTSFGTSPSAILPGFALSNAPGVVPPSPTWQYVQTTSTTTAAFTDEVGGAATPFALDSIGLANPQSCSCSVSVTIKGFLGGSLVATQTFGIPGGVVGGNGNPGVPASVDIFSLTAPGFADVDKVEVLPLGANVNVNDITIGAAPTSVPEPSTWAMMLVGFAGLAFAGWRARGGFRLAA